MWQEDVSVDVLWTLKILSRLSCYGTSAVRNLSKPWLVDIVLISHKMTSFPTFVEKLRWCAVNLTNRPVPFLLIRNLQMFWCFTWCSCKIHNMPSCKQCCTSQFLPRLVECRSVLAMSEMSVHPSVCVCPSVKRVDCDKTKETCAHILILRERSYILVFWQEERLVAATPSTWNLGQNWPCWSQFSIDIRS